MVVKGHSYNLKQNECATNSNQITSPDDGTVPSVHFMEPCTCEMMVCLHLLCDGGENI